MASMTSSLSGLFQDSVSIGEQYRRGVLGTALGFEVAMDQNTINIYTGSRDATGVMVDGANQTGSNLYIRGLTAGATIRAGEIFNITAVNGVNPENLAPWQVPVSAGQGDINFVALTDATADSAGRAMLSISPSITVVCEKVTDATVTASPADGAAIHWKSGGEEQMHMQSLAYHQDAFTFATADLELPMGVDFAARESYDGISMRIVRAYDVTNDQFPCRIDVLGGWQVLRPELACRITA